MNAKHQIVIVGGGIAGSAAFAVLSGSIPSKVTLIERQNRVGLCTTSTNNGRCHSGATGVFSDPPKVTSRKVLASSIMRALPIRWESDSKALYVCSDPTGVAEFARACLERGIKCDPANDGDGAEWFGIGVDGRSFYIDELAFDPVELCERFIGCGLQVGGEILYGVNAIALNPRKKGQIELTGVGYRSRPDLVLDMTSKFHGQISVEGRPPLVSLYYYRWPIMSAPAEFLPRLTRILNVVGEKTLNPSVIPHGGWITFDCKNEPERVGGAEDNPAFNPGSIDPSRPQEKRILESIQDIIPVARVIQDNINACSVFYGIQGRRAGEESTSDLCCSYRYEDISGYIVRNGGLATSAVVDAFDLCNEVQQMLGLPVSSYEHMLAALSAGLFKSPIPEYKSKMLYALSPG